jgi:hypothetical protein
MVSRVSLPRDVRPATNTPIAACVQSDHVLDLSRRFAAFSGKKYILLFSAFRKVLEWKTSLAYPGYSKKNGGT